MGTVIIGGILIFIVTLAIKSMIHDKKSGKSIQCGGDCSHCRGNCH